MRCERNVRSFVEIHHAWVENRDDLPDVGQMAGQNGLVRASMPDVSDDVAYPANVAVVEDLLDQLERTTQLSRPALTRVVAEIVEYFGETAEQFVRRRHLELQQEGHRNDRIWNELLVEIRRRPFAAPPLSLRQLRRIVYG
jgi:hypothetical protein